MLGNRSASQIMRAVAGKQHYTALFNMLRYYPDFWRNLYRYLSGRGAYPDRVRVRTPCGVISPNLFSHHDLLTVNEVFCRNDYEASTGLEVAVDLGSNIGISALYFLTRNHTSRCYLYEPDPRNIARLHENLAGFQERYRISAVAVSDRHGRLEFGTEPTGRYGGLSVPTGNSIMVDCLEINAVLTEILKLERRIDILKIDTEGVEIDTVKAIRPEFLARIGKIYLEARPPLPLHPKWFIQQQYGSVCRLINKNPCMITRNRDNNEPLRPPDWAGDAAND